MGELPNPNIFAKISDIKLGTNHRQSTKRMSFPVIHKADSKGIFVLLKYEKSRYIYRTHKFLFNVLWRIYICIKINSVDNYLKYIYSPKLPTLPTYGKSTKLPF